MQLESPKRPQVLRDALHTAALALMLAPATAQAQSDPADRIDVTSLFYGEQGRTQVVEPVVRFTHLLPDGQSVSAQLGIDVMTGASPTGAVPSGEVQTRTSASGRTITSPAGQIPTASFHDRRLALDGAWQKPWGRFVTSNLGGHFSREKDYQSVGVNGKFSTDLDHRLVTLTIGGSVDHDRVFPVGGTPDGLSDGTIVSSASNPKTVTSALLGVSRVLSRRWIFSVNGSRTMEKGYLTEPYKVVSLLNFNGVPVGELTDKRPSTRNRSAVLLSSVYHLSDDVLYSSYRYYWDTWSIRSHTIDVKYRHDLDSDSYVEPLLRLYTQSAASFYTAGIPSALRPPDFASSDYRLGSLRTITLGATYGFRTDMSPGDWSIRAQYIRQAGNSSPPNAIGIQRQFDLAPPVNIYAFVVGYSFGY
ncbi:MAG: DUF3570 domain-containing protein [Thermoanaerobaculia bacterium]